MRDEYNVLCALATCLIHGFLNLCVEFAPVFILVESIDEFSVFILKKFWCGGDQCLGRAHTDESNFLAVERDAFMCLKYGFICPLVDEVAAVVPACGASSKKRSIPKSYGRIFQYKEECDI